MNNNTVALSTDTTLELELDDCLSMLDRYTKAINNIKVMMSEGVDFDRAISSSCRKIDIYTSQSLGSSLPIKQSVI